MFIVVFARDQFTFFLNVIVYFLFIAKCFATIMSKELSVIFLFLCFLHTFFNVNVLLHATHTCLFFCMGVLEAVISFTSYASSISDLFLFFVAHQHLPWANYLIPWHFQNSLSYCGLIIFMSISFFIIMSITLFSLSFSFSSFVLHSKQFDSHTSEMWLSSSFLFLSLLPP